VDLKTDLRKLRISIPKTTRTRQITIARRIELTCTALFFVRLAYQQLANTSAVFFSQNKPAISNQPAVLFSQNKSAPAISQTNRLHFGVLCV
jgi:hypothetical protein